MPTEEYLKTLAESFGLAPADRLFEFVGELVALGVPGDLVELFFEQLREVIPGGGDNCGDNCGDTNRVLVNLQRFVAASRSPQSWLTLFEREPDSLAMLAKLFSASQYMADILIADPESFDLLRITGGQPVEKQMLEDEIMAAIGAIHDSRSVMRLLRDYRHRETLRIAYGDFIVGQPVDVVTEQISILAECLVGAAVWAAKRDLAGRRTGPQQPDGTPVSFVVIALGKLGGRELNYSSDIDLLFVAEDVRDLHSSRNANFQAAEYFQRLGQAVIKLLSETTENGCVYRVDLRLRPYGEQSPLVVHYSDALNYYDSMGRTWERQVFIKARSIAGDVELGNALIESLQPWVYRRYLMRADITGIAALRRRIEQRAAMAGDEHGDVKEGRGGIRDIEDVIQFLQLFNGGDEPSVRCSGTLEAIGRLHAAGSLTSDEESALTESYRFLRRIEHMLQLMFDRQTHCLPSDPTGLAKVATRMGYRDESDRTAAAALQWEVKQRVTSSHCILERLLQNAFLDEVAESDSFGAPHVTPESDLVLDPQPPAEAIQTVLEPYGFSDCEGAYRNLQQLSVENIPFLSTRRCRQFLSGIAPQLLAAVAQTPNPDATLVSLANVSDSLGGKSVLWELFSVNPPSMYLCIRLCACSPYLASLLTSNPGMIDELLDSLMLDTLPDRDALSRNLEELCRNALDIAPILHSFKNSMHLRVGVRDVLGRDAIRETHAALSDIAEVCMERVIHHEFHRLINQLGMPTGVQGEIAELIVLAVGKLGGREPNYHSDLDVIFLFDHEGMTKSLVPNRRFEPTTNRHFFNQLSQRVIHAVTRIGNTGRLFDIDVRLRPLGRSGELAITIDDLCTYFSNSGGQVWERQALCKARPIWGSPQAQNAAMDCVHQVLMATEDIADAAQQIYDHRMQLQQGVSERNLKRGVGGTMDVEFVVQLLQLAHCRNQPSVLTAGTFDAIDRLKEAGCLESSVADAIYGYYEFSRSVESGIRLMNMSARHEIPDNSEGLRQLAFLLSSRESGNFEDTHSFSERCSEVRTSCRDLFESVFDDWMLPSQTT